MSIDPDTSQAFEMPYLPWAPRRAAITTIIKVFGMTRPGIDQAIFSTRIGRATTTPPRRYDFGKDEALNCEHDMY